MQIEVLALLVDDRVDGDSRLAGLPVADDQLTLAAADGDHRVDGLDACLHGRVNALAHHHVGGDTLHRAELAGLDRTFSVDGLADRVHDAPDQGVTNGHRDNASGGPHQVAFLDVAVLTHDDDTDRVLAQVEHDAQRAAGKLYQFTGSRVGQADNLGDAVADFDHGADVHHPLWRFEAFDLLANQHRQILRAYCHLIFLQSWASWPKAPGFGASKPGGWRHCCPTVCRRRE